MFGRSFWERKEYIRLLRMAKDHDHYQLIFDMADTKRSLIEGKANLFSA